MARNTRYTGNNPIYAGPGTSYDPLTQARERSYRTTQGLGDVGESVLGVIDENRKRKQASIESIPDMPELVSKGANKAVGDIINQTTNELAKSLKEGFLYDFEDQAEFSRGLKKKEALIEQYSSFDEQFSIFDKAYNKNPDRYIPEKVEANKEKINALLGSGNTDAFSIDLNKAFELKGSDYKGITAELIKTNDRSRETLKTIEDVGGEEISKSITTGEYTDKNGNIDKGKVMKEFDRMYDDQFHLGLAQEMLINGEYGEEAKQAYINGDINPMQIPKESVSGMKGKGVRDYWYDQTYNMFDRNVRSKTIKDIKDRDKGKSKKKTITVNNVANEQLQTSIATERDEEGNPVTFEDNTIQFNNIEKPLDDAGNPLVVKKVRLDDGIFLGDFKGEGFKGTDVHDLTIEGIGMVEDLNPLIDKMASSKGLSEVDKTYISKMKSNITKKNIPYVFGSVGGNMMIVPLEKISTRLNALVEGGYKYKGLKQETNDPLGIL